MARFRIMRRLALRNIVTHWVSSTVVGSIIVFGTCLVVLGTSILDTIDQSMARSITSSLAGHIQIYAADAQDDLALFGSGMMGTPEIGTIPNFAQVRDKIEALDNVAAVIPMGMSMHTDVPSSDLDNAITRLRRAVGSGNQGQVEMLAEQIRGMAADIQDEQEKTRAISASEEADRIDERLEVLTRVRSDEFWADLQRDPETHLTYLDTRLAALSLEGEMLWMRNLGTDLTRFAERFDRFELVHGRMVPQGQRGMLLAERFYEQQVKNLAARMLDELHEGVTERGLTIAGDPELKDKARRLPGQYRRVTFELNPADAEAITEALRPLLPERGDGINEAIMALLTVDDDNLEKHYAAFYEHVAPRIRLYKVNVGDTLALRSYTKSGYIKALTVEVYGVYRFKSLEKSDLAGAQNLLDMVTFRELFGVMTEEKRAELAGIKEEVGARNVTRDEAEAALFGGADELAIAADEVGFEEEEVFGSNGALTAATAIDDTFDPTQIDRGLALNAAVILEDPAQLEETRRQILAVSEAENLNLQAVDWQKASGIVGQLIIVIRIVLYVAIFIIFLVALAIINNSMVMSTLERTGEIGTMRALGAQRSFVMGVFLLETLIVGAVAGALGAVAGALAVTGLGNVGIPAATDIMVFLFSGPRLFPEVGASNIGFALVVIFLVSLVSTFYPARIAARVQPVVAMQAKE
jgi:ABC-type lipoprotein release transport system permease subunit